MINTEGIEVYVKAADQDEPYKEHVKPSFTNDANTMQRYVELEMGKEFRIVVKIHPNFSWPTPQLRISRILAGTNMWCALHPPAHRIRDRLPLISEIGKWSVDVLTPSEKKYPLSLSSLFLPFSRSKINIVQMKMLLWMSIVRMKNHKQREP